MPADENIGYTVHDEPPGSKWGEPDMSVMRENRRPPPRLPLEVFDGAWANWIATAARAAGCPPDYVMAPLLASASVLIGHARWVQATSGWCEPPHLWLGEVGDSGTGKSPGSDCLLRDVLPEIERRMLGDFPNDSWSGVPTSRCTRLDRNSWKADVREAQRRNHAAPMPPAEMLPPEPQAPRLRQNDVTVPKLAVLLGTTASKGLLVIRDELTGWLNSMTAYNDADREFWIEAYGGRPFRVERQKKKSPYHHSAARGGCVRRHATGKTCVSVQGRGRWVIFPLRVGVAGALPFHLASEVPNAQWAIEFFGPTSVA